MSGLVERPPDLAGSLAHKLGLVLQASSDCLDFLGIAVADVLVARRAGAGDDDAARSGGKQADLTIREAEGSGNLAGIAPAVSGFVEPAGQTRDIREIRRGRGAEVEFELHS